MFKLVSADLSQPVFHSFSISSKPTPKAPLLGTLPSSALVQHLGGEAAFRAAADARIASEQGGIKVSPYHLGDFNTDEIKPPQVFKEAFDRAWQSGKTGYCPAPGPESTREVVSTYFERQYGQQYAVANIAITEAKAIIAKVMLMFETHVAVPIPGYPIADSVARGVQNTTSEYRYLPGGQLDLASVEQSFAKGAKLFYFNDPSNPLGSIQSKETVEGLMALLKKYPDVYVLGDVAYSRIVYDGKTLNTQPLWDMLKSEERLFLADTFSKVGAATGLRIGYVGIPNRLDQATGKTWAELFNSLTSNIESCPVLPFCIALEATLNSKLFDDHIRLIVEVLEGRRNVLLKHFSDIDGLTVLKPDAAFYVDVDAAKLMKDLGFGTDTELFRKTVLAQTGISFCSGHFFGATVGEHYPGTQKTRFAFSAVNVAQIEEDMVRFKTWIGERKHAMAVHSEGPVVIMGGGNVGLSLAHKLGCGVSSATLVTRDADAILKESKLCMTIPIVVEVGVKRLGSDSTAPVTVVSSSAGIKEASIVYLATQIGTKTAKELADIIRPGGILVCMQNGLETGEDLAQSPEFQAKGIRVLRSVMSVQVTDIGGQIAIKKEIESPVGPVQGSCPISDEELQSISKAMRGAGIKDARGLDAEEIKKAAFEKLLKNLANFASARLLQCLGKEGQGVGYSYGDLLGGSDEVIAIRAELYQAIDEFRHFAHANGVDLGTQEEAVKRVLTYVSTTHISSTVNAISIGMPAEMFLKYVLEHKPEGAAYPQLEAYNQMLHRYNVQDRRPHHLPRPVFTDPNKLGERLEAVVSKEVLAV